MKPACWLSDHQRSVSYQFSIDSQLLSVAVRSNRPAICIEKAFDMITRRGPSQAVGRSSLKTDTFSEVEPWISLLAANTPGMLPVTIPTFLAQGTGILFPSQFSPD
jgi:hypothetical protein